MSITLALSGQSSDLSYNFNPPLYLDDDVEYEVGLTNFETYNSIPNIDDTNNKFKWGKNYEHTVTLPTGAYNIDDITNYMTNAITQEDKDVIIRITPDVNISKVIIHTNINITFDVDNSISPLLGFRKRILKDGDNYVSDDIVRISKVNTLCIDCNFAVGSFFNGKPVHIIHQFFPTVPVGYKIVESPLNIIYFPVSVKTINNVTIKVLDQDNNLVNFRKETITVRLHLRKIRS